MTSGGRRDRRADTSEGETDVQQGQDKEEASMEMQKASTAPSDCTSESSSVVGPPYTWREMARRPFAQCLGMIVVVLSALIVTVIAVAGTRAEKCVWIHGVCYDRP